LDFNDLKIEYQIYQAEVCVVYKGKYKALPVAIKIYNLSRLKEEDIVRFLFTKIFCFDNYIFLKNLERLQLRNKFIDELETSKYSNIYRLLLS